MALQIWKWLLYISSSISVPVVFWQGRFGFCICAKCGAGFGKPGPGLVRVCSGSVMWLQAIVGPVCKKTVGRISFMHVDRNLAYIWPESGFAIRATFSILMYHVITLLGRSQKCFEFMNWYWGITTVYKDSSFTWVYVHSQQFYMNISRPQCNTTLYSLTEPSTAHQSPIQPTRAQQSSTVQHTHVQPCAILCYGGS